MSIKTVITVFKNILIATAEAALIIALCSVLVVVLMKLGLTSP